MWDVLKALPGLALPALMFYFFFVRPARRVRGAKSWLETPCVIVASAVKEDETDSGLYTLLVTYQYDFGGQSYRSSRYSFSVLATAGYRGKKRVAGRLAPGTSAVCYVNPDDPRDSVIDRGLTWDMVFSAVFAAIFFGAFVLVR
jgi:hypothetical protein